MSSGRSKQNMSSSECSGSTEIARSSTESMSYIPPAHTKATSRAPSPCTLPNLPEWFEAASMTYMTCTHTKAASRASTPDPYTPPNSPERFENDDDNAKIDPNTQKRPIMITDDAAIDSIEKGFKKIKGVQHPPKARPLSGYLSFFPNSEKTKETNHEIEPAKHKETLHIVKHNEDSSPISELEAAAWAHYHLLVPHVVPDSSRAYYNADGDYVAVSSRVIPNFISFRNRPLTEADFANEEIIKTLAECLTASYLFKEDDLHIGNIGLKCDDSGNPIHVVKIDFDMSFWPVLQEHKKSNAIDYAARRKSFCDYIFTDSDITTFPRLENANHFYWPARTLKNSHKVTTLVIALFSKNDYNEENAIFFRKLQDNKTFKFYQYQTMLKYALTTPEMFCREIKEHLREDLLHTNGRTLVDVLVDYQTNEINALKALLLTNAAFGKVFYTAGATFLENILADFTKRNSQLDEKIEKAKTPERKETLRQLKIDLDDFTTRFNQFSITRNYNTVSENMSKRMKL